MSEKLVIGPINKGLRNDRTAFVIDNDNFPVLQNAYQWRGRVKRKRGTEFLSILTRYFDSNSTAYNSGSATIALNGSGEGNLLTGFSLTTNAPNSSIVPAFSTYAAVITTDPGGVSYTDVGDGTLSPSGTINYATGAITIAAAAGQNVTATFLYYPHLPVMGLEDFEDASVAYLKNESFDTVYSYRIINNGPPYLSYANNFYKNLATDTYTGYVQKTTWTPTTWNGFNYQQFGTINYQGALWTTNGIGVPFDATKVGMQFKAITGVTIGAAGPPALANLTITGHGLVVGDFVFINEVVGITGINWQTGYVTVVVDPNTVTVEFPNATLGGIYTSGGIAQYLTNRSDTTRDCLRWFDGDPTSGSATAPTFLEGKGWVNFMPPLSRSAFSIADLPARIYYLVGAKIIQEFKDRILFIGPVVQTSDASPNPIYLQDTVIYSQNGTPYYTCSFTGDVSATTTVFHEILVPTNQTATANAYFSDQTGFGGFVSSGLNQPINTVSLNEDVLIMGFTTNQVRFIYTGNDLIPFNFYRINSELGSASTFSTINMDRGVLTAGSRGFIVTNQNEAQRFDLDVPDEVFQINRLNNGFERLCSARDFQREWLYFTYLSDSYSSNFPNQSLFYNYRDISWAIFYESFTTYGNFSKIDGLVWSTVGNIYLTWSSWNVSWNSMGSNVLEPEVIGGNQQGYVILKSGTTTSEGKSLFIKSFSSNTVTSPDHGLNDNDFITIDGCLGTIGSTVNGNIYKINVLTLDTFTINETIPGGATYLGSGEIIRLFKPFIQTKQFPTAWGESRKTRIGPQQYLLSKTTNAQITLYIFLSQDGDIPYNAGTIVPDVTAVNNTLIYSTVLYTCPESTNLGLTPANINLQMVTAGTQQQIWHRINTSLLGDTVQLGFTLSDEQMESGEGYNTAEIELHSIILEVSPSMVLA